LTEIFDDIKNEKIFTDLYNNACTEYP
jgi:hypothetical protein